jgi:hypothetical protein
MKGELRVPNDTTTAHPTPKNPPSNGTAPDSNGSRTRAPETADAVVVLALPAGTSPTWRLVAQVLDWHSITARLPASVLPVRHPRLSCAILRCSPSAFLAPLRHRGAVRAVAGGPVSRLDLVRATALARDVAAARWWTWQRHVGATTPPAKPWEHFRTEHDRNPARLSLDEAERRFNAQPRVLAMLAYNSYPFNPHHLRIDELAGYQAGLTVYVALHWQRPLVGDALVTPTGVLLRPRSPSVADNLHYLAAATQVVHALTGSDHLVAVQAALPPHRTS